MHLDLSADDVLTTTRSVRKRLDLDRPVDRSVVEECLEIALQAPTGSNSQGWQFVFVEDPAKKQALADIYARNFQKYAGVAASNQYQPGDPRHDQKDRVTSSAMHLVENFHRVPILMIPCITGSLDKAPTFQAASAWGSILPAVWSFMLALRERSLGSAWTTIHLMDGGDAEAAELLGIPHDEVTQAGLFPIAYTVGTDFKLADRLPLDTVLHWDEW
ncbi:nitroreductase family protein [Ilumatobacter sp.]|uniref:nitroreductase family protein n=1 Tax=Ilumatobacter sp. TaxID=1967498 RepID=UPI003C4F4673